MVDFRFRDLMPDIPLIDDGTTMDVYADDVGTVELLGTNFRMTYITWGHAHGVPLMRRPVIRITRPITSMISQRMMSLLREGQPLIAGTIPLVHRTH